MSFWRIVLIFIAVAPQALANAWPRGAGTTFVSLSYSLSADPASLGTGSFDPDGYLSLLVERGFTERLSFGLDAGMAETGDYQAVLFGSWALSAPDAPHRFAVHAGGGYSRTGAVEEPLIYAGASWGRGFDTRWGPGWAALDGKAFYRTGTGGTILKADLTIGVSPRDRLKIFAQVQAGQYPNADAYLRIVPSAAYEFAPGKHVELGLSAGVIGDTDIGVKIGTWLNF